MNNKKFFILFALPLVLVGCKKAPKAKIVDIELGGNYPTLFAQDGEFSYEGLEVYAVYSNNKQKQVTDFEVSTPDMSTIGFQDVEVTYKTFMKSYSIEIEYRNNPERGRISFTMPASLNESIEEYNFKFDYNNNYFRHSATQIDDDLKMLSFASSVVSDSVERASAFFGGMFFDNFQYYDYETITEDTIGHFFARKIVDDFELYAVSIRGFEYQAEWANNFMIGNSDDHYGFSLRANDVFGHLVAYISTLHTPDKVVKVWMSGYSRAGAISDFVSMKLMTTNIFNINANTLYTYTFEAPASVSDAHSVSYTNVFNFYNSTDLIPYIPPQQYGLRRTGTDLDIYDANVDNLVANFDSQIVIPTFTAKSGRYDTEPQFIAHLLDGMLENTGDEGSMATRQEYVNNYQTDLAYLISMVFTLPPETSDKVMASLTNIGAADAFQIIIGNDPLHEKIEAVLDEDGIEYDKTKLESATGKLCTFIRSHFSLTGGKLINEFIEISIIPPSGSINQKMVDNVSRAVTMHYPEITYCLLANTHYNTGE